jgi:hypothetical protein
MVWSPHLRRTKHHRHPQCAAWMREAGTAPRDHVGIQAHDPSGPPCLPAHHPPIAAVAQRLAPPAGLAPDQCRSLLDSLAQLADPRHRRGRQHPLVGVLGVAVCAVLSCTPLREGRGAPAVRVEAPRRVNSAVRRFHRLRMELLQAEARERDVGERSPFLHQPQGVGSDAGELRSRAGCGLTARTQTTGGSRSRVSVLVFV